MAASAPRNIPMLDLRAQHEPISGEIYNAVKGVLDTQQFILGQDVAGLEEEIAAYTGAAYAVGCASGSDALLLALMALGIGSGDEVITTPFTFFATAGAIVRLGAKPVFVDIDSVTFNIDPRLIERAVTPKIKVILPVHLFGQCADMDPINSLAGNHGIAVVEDAAQAIGATYRGRKAGSLGLVGAFSFYPSKNLGGAGDGGMLTTSDSRLAEKLRCLRAHGATKKYYHDHVGINSRLDSIQAAILRVKLRYIDEWARGRRSNANTYRTLFSGSGLVADGRVKLPVESEFGLHVYNQFVIRAESRDELRLHLRGCGIGTEVYYPLPLHLQKCFSDLGYRPGDLPQSELAAKQALAIPVFPELERSAQEYIADAVSAFYKKR